MYNYQKISKDVGKGMKGILNSVGSLASIPLTLPGVRTVTKSAIKGGMIVSDKMQQITHQAMDEWNQLVDEARREMKKKPVKALKKNTAKALEKEKNKDYESWNVEDLYDLAQELDIKGRSQMNKEELIKAIREKT